MLLWAVAWTGCRPGDVVYDAVGGEDAIDDLVYATLLFGKAESDAGEIEGPHAAGGTLTIHARRTRSVGGLQWFATTMAPDIARVAAADTTENGLTMTLEFLKAGTTDLFLFDEHGTVIDVQLLQVREATDAALVPWDDLAAGRDTPIEGDIHVVGGSELSLAVTWRDDHGVVLRGGDLLEVDGSDATFGVTVGGRFTGGADVVDVSVEPDAPPARFPFTITSPLVESERDLVVHSRDEVDALVLDEAPAADGEGGLVLARVEADGERMIGAPVRFRYDGESQVGTGFVWESGPTTTVEACFDQLCQTTVLRGRPTEIVGAVADTEGCGCRTTPMGGLAALLVAIGLARRRRW